MDAIGELRAGPDNDAGQPVSLAPNAVGPLAGSPSQRAGLGAASAAVSHATSTSGSLIEPEGPWARGPPSCQCGGSSLPAGADEAQSAAPILTGHAGMEMINEMVQRRRLESHLLQQQKIDERSIELSQRVLRLRLLHTMLVL